MPMTAAMLLVAAPAEQSVSASEGTAWAMVFQKNEHERA